MDIQSIKDQYRHEKIKRWMLSSPLPGSVHEHLIKKEIPKGMNFWLRHPINGQSWLEWVRQAPSDIQDDLLYQAMKNDHQREGLESTLKGEGWIEQWIEKDKNNNPGWFVDGILPATQTLNQNEKENAGLSRQKIIQILMEQDQEELAQRVVKAMKWAYELGYKDEQGKMWKGMFDQLSSVETMDVLVSQGLWDRGPQLFLKEWWEQQLSLFKRKDEETESQYEGRIRQECWLIVKMMGLSYAFLFQNWNQENTEKWRRYKQEVVDYLFQDPELKKMLLTRWVELLWSPDHTKYSLEKDWIKEPRVRILEKMGMDHECLEWSHQWNQEDVLEGECKNHKKFQPLSKALATSVFEEDWHWVREHVKARVDFWDDWNIPNPKKVQDFKEWLIDSISKLQSQNDDEKAMISWESGHAFRGLVRSMWKWDFEIKQEVYHSISSEISSQDRQLWIDPCSWSAWNKYQKKSKNQDQKSLKFHDRASNQELMDALRELESLLNIHENQWKMWRDELMSCSGIKKGRAWSFMGFMDHHDNKEKSASDGNEKPSIVRILKPWHPQQDLFMYWSHHDYEFSSVHDLSVFKDHKKLQSERLRRLDFLQEVGLGVNYEQIKNQWAGWKSNSSFWQEMTKTRKWEDEQFNAWADKWALKNAMNSEHRGSLESEKDLNGEIKRKLKL